MNTQNNYEYHKLLKFLYFEGYADSYEEAQYVLEELNCDGVLEYLIDEGYSDTFEDAVVIMENMSEEWRRSIVEGMTLKDFKQQRSRQKQKDKREALKTSPTHRTGIHADKSSPERASRHRANVDPDYDNDDEEDMYPGGITKSAKKIRKQKAVGEHDN
jgi:hypothetical protein